MATIPRIHLHEHFKNFMECHPPPVRKLGVSKAYPAISFQININGGNVYMGKTSSTKLRNSSASKWSHSLQIKLIPKTRMEFNANLGEK